MNVSPKLSTLQENLTLSFPNRLPHISHYRIIHDTDADGNCAAWIVNRFLRECKIPTEEITLELIPLRAGDNNLDPSYFEDNDLAEYLFIVVDRSLPISTLSRMLDANANIIILDHHKTSMNDLHTFYEKHPEKFGEDRSIRTSSFNYELSELTIESEKVCIIFDLKHSGCGIAKNFITEIIAERSSTHCKQTGNVEGHLGSYFIDYIEDRDLWLHNLGNTEEVNAYISANNYTLDFFNMEYANEVRGMSTHLSFVIATGKQLLKYRQSLIDNVLKSCPPQYVTTRDIFDSEDSVTCAVMFNVPSMIFSDVANHILENKDGKQYQNVHVVLNVSDFYETEETTGTPPGAVHSHYTLSQISMRSKKWIDVSVIAKKLGGGGHCNAAGFRRPLPETRNGIGLMMTIFELIKSSAST